MREYADLFMNDAEVFVATIAIPAIVAAIIYLFRMMIKDRAI